MLKKSLYNFIQKQKKHLLFILVLGMGLGTIAVYASSETVVDYARTNGFNRIGNLYVGSTVSNIGDCNPISTNPELKKSCLGVAGDILGSNLQAGEKVVAYKANLGGSGSEGSDLYIGGSGKSITASSLSGSSIRPVCANAEGVLTNDNCSAESSSASYAWATSDWGSCGETTTTAGGCNSPGFDGVAMYPSNGNPRGIYLGDGQEYCESRSSKTSCQNAKASPEGVDPVQEVCEWSEPKTTTVNTGEKSRTVQCVNAATGIPAADSSCSGTRPTASDTSGCSSTGTVSDLCSENQYSFYINGTPRNKTSDFCGSPWQVGSEVHVEFASNAYLGRRVCKDGQPLDGDDKWYIVQTSPYTYPGDSSFYYWQIGSDGIVVSNGEFQGCIDGSDGHNAEF